MAPRLLRRRPRFAPVDLPTTGPARPDLTVAVVLDPFSELAFRYEWNQVTFGPDDWRAVLGRTRPDLLFVESAWQGNAVAGRRGRTEGRWRLHMTRDDRPSPELTALVAWCRAEGIPTVFWNKEDPPNYDRFLETARLFDQVFTVDAERIPDYQRDLGHDRDRPAAVRRPAPHPQPGTRAARKPARRRLRRHLVRREAPRAARRRWPTCSTRRASAACTSGRGCSAATSATGSRGPTGRHVVGSLPYERMLAAYTAYKVFLNVNSVTRSKTMCSRRLFELSAAQTAVVSAPAASIEPFFGATIEVVENAEETGRALDVLLGNAEYRDRLALQAHRRVFDEHLYAHRVDTVLRSVGLAARRVDDPVGQRDRPDEASRAAGPRPGDHRPAVAPRDRAGPGHPRLHRRDRRRSTGSTSSWCRPTPDLTLGACMNLGVEAATGDLVAKVDDDNFYGTHYLTDLVRALDYSGADVVGKWAHLVHLESSGATLLRFEKAEHRFVEQVQGGTPADAADRGRADPLRGPAPPGRHHVPGEGAGRRPHRLRRRPVQLRVRTTRRHGQPHVADLRQGASWPARPGCCSTATRPRTRRPEMTLLTDRPSPAEPRRRAEKPKGNSPDPPRHRGAAGGGHLPGAAVPRGPDALPRRLRRRRRVLRDLRLRDHRPADQGGRPRGHVNLLGFYARRAKRLLPASAVVLVATAVMTWLWVPRIRWETTGGDIVASSLYFVNWRLADRSVDYLAEDVTPSAGAALLVAVGGGAVLLRLAAAAARRGAGRRGSGRPAGRAARRPGRGRRTSLLWAGHEAVASPERAYFITTTRMWEFTIGAFVAIAGDRLDRMPRALAVVLAWAGLGMILVSGRIFTADMTWPGYSALLPTVGTGW